MAEKPSPRRRLDIRTPPAIRLLLEAAARESKESLSLYVLNAAVGRAQIHVWDRRLIDEALSELRYLNVVSHTPLTGPQG